MSGGDLRAVYDPDHGGMTTVRMTYIIPCTGIWQSAVLLQQQYLQFTAVRKLRFCSTAETQFAGAGSAR